MRRSFWTKFAWVVLASALIGWPGRSFGSGPAAATPAKFRPGGLVVVVGLPAGQGPQFVVDLARSGGELVYFQSPDAADVQAVREAAEKAGQAGLRIFAARGPWDALHLADNLADVVHPHAPAGEKSRREVLRVLRPGGSAMFTRVRDGAQDLDFFIKLSPKGTDDWSHPQHGPNNNPLSTDQIALAPYRTQYLAEPMFCPLPTTTVAAGGRIFKVFGHLAFRDNQNDLLNSLLAANAFNGALLWRRPLSEGFDVHRNTLIATPELLFLGDDESCKLLDAQTGRLRREIVVPAGIADGPVWKWMALADGKLFALIGGSEVKVKRQTAKRPGLSHWSWKPFQAQDFSDPKTSIGFGRTLAAVDPATGKFLWHHRETDYLDGRAVCMDNGRIYAYSPGKFLLCLDAAKGAVLWKASSPELLDAIGPPVKRQYPHTGFATQIYLYCNEKYVLFAGPQRPRVVAVSAETGKLLWQTSKEVSSTRHLVLRPDAIYSIVTGDKSGAKSGKLDYATGKMLGELPSRWNCVRVTANADSMFSRGVFGATISTPARRTSSRRCARGAWTASSRPTGCSTGARGRAAPATCRSTATSAWRRRGRSSRPIRRAAPAWKRRLAARAA